MEIEKTCDALIELSICVPCYNGGNDVISCVNNVLSYKGNDIEVIVSDNASQDDSVCHLKKIKDKRLKIFVNEENVGPFRNWYLALTRGSGKYVMLLQDNDQLVVENLEEYLYFLHKSNYDVIKNAYKNQEHITGAITRAQNMYCGNLYSHVSYLVYRGDVIRNLKPIECSFDYKFCEYPHFIWDMQIMQKYNPRDKNVYINSDIKIVKLLEKNSNSRTRDYVKQAPTSFTFESAVYMFNNSGCLLKEFYQKAPDYLEMYLYLYKGYLFRGTVGFYEHMTDAHARARYGLEEKCQDVDYIGLNKVFWKHAIQKLEIKRGIQYYVMIVKLFIVTIHNKLLFKLNFIYKRSFINMKYLVGCILNRFLNFLLRILL